MAKHMDSIMRNQIQFWIESGKTTAWIAQKLGKHPSTIWRELLNHRIKSDKRYGCSNRLCAKFDVCTRQSYGATDYKSLAKNKPGCFEACPDFHEQVCERLSKAPFVCNGCENERTCPLKKRYYIAEGAEASYRSLLVNCRAGVRPDDETAAKMSGTIRVHWGQTPKRYAHFCSSRGDFAHISGDRPQIVLGTDPKLCRGQTPQNSRSHGSQAHPRRL